MSIAKSIPYRASILLFFLLIFNACKPDYTHLIDSYNNGDATHKLKVVNRLLVLLEDESDYVKRDAIITLGTIKDTAGVVPLIEFLLHQNWEVRRDAAVSLGRVRDKRAVVPLTVYLKSGENRFEYWAAMNAIINIGDSRSVPTLIKFIETSHNDVLQRAIYGVSKLESDATPELLEILKSNDDPNVRLSIVLAFGENNTTEALEQLKVVLQSDDQSVVRKEAAIALGKIRDENSIHALIEALMDVDMVEQEAYKALVSFGEDAISQLHKELLSSPGNYYLIRVLGDIGSKESTELLMDLLEKKEEAIIYSECMVALGKIGEKKSVNSIVGFLNHWYLKDIAAESLEKLHWKPQNQQELFYYFSAVDKYDVLLEKWETTKVIYLADLNSTDTQAYENAIYTLIKLGNDTVVGDLINKLNRNGTKHIAEIYLNCGQEKLKTASEKWAYKHGYYIEYSNNETNIPWGVW